MALRIEDEAKIASDARHWAGVMRDEARVCPGERLSFQHWLMPSVVRVKHYLIALAYDDTLQGLKRASTDTPDELCERLREAVVEEEGGGAVTRLVTRARARWGAVRGRHHSVALSDGGSARHWGRAALAVVFGVVVVGALIWSSGVLSSNDYRSGATPLHVTLSDGSDVTLKPFTHLVVDFSSHERGARLDSGDATFSVHPDARRPFRVRSGASETEAVGTRFRTAYDGRDTRVSVLEGHVRVTGLGAASSAGSTDLLKGQETRVTATGVVEPPRVTADLVLPAISSELHQFQRTALGDVACLFNTRLGVVKFIVEGAARRRPFTAALSLDDVDAFIGVLEHYKSLRLSRRGEAIVIREVGDRTPGGVMPSSSESCPPLPAVPPGNLGDNRRQVMR